MTLYYMYVTIILGHFQILLESAHEKASNTYTTGGIISPHTA